MAKRINLKDIITCCEARLGRGLAEDWKHSDFLALHREILRSTKVNISHSTLKRIFGKVSVDDDYIPQQATLNALIEYGGCLHIHLNSAEANVLGKKREPNLGIQTRIKYVAYGIIAIFIVFFAINTLIQNVDLKGVVKLKEMEGILPSTAFFDIKAQATSDSIFIDFGDRSSIIPLKNNQASISHNYLIPGVFDVRLFTKKRTIATTNVSVKSNKWIGLGFRRQRELPDHYYAFSASKDGKDSLFNISNLQLKSKGVDTTGSLFTRLCNYTNLDANGDNFIFQTTFKNSISDKGIYCNATQLKISGLKGIIKFRFVNSGCSAKAEYVMGEQSNIGSNSNLSALVIDLKQWNRLRLINRERQLSLYVNDKLIFKGAYQTSIGNLQGVFVEFEGNGFIKTCSLKTLDNKTLLNF